MLAQLIAYCRQHRQASVASLGAMWRSPLANFMTVSVIAIALSLPMCLYLLLVNAKVLTSGWDHGGQLSLFFSVDTPEEELAQLQRVLSQRDDVLSVHYISAEQGLHDLEAMVGFGEVLHHLPNNPLPPVLQVFPQPSVTATPALLQQWVDDFQQLRYVESARLDRQWLQRLQGLLALGQHAALALMLLLSLAVLLVVANTLRLAIQNRQQAIEVMKLVGATNRFVRRPFLYSGLFYGLAGGLLALLLVQLLIWWLSVPVNRLAALYASEFFIQGLSMRQGVYLLLFSCLLGLFASYVAVGRQLVNIEPQHVA